MTSATENLTTVLADLLLALADDKLMLGHRNSDWTGLGPILEEDIAFSSLAQTRWRMPRRSTSSSAVCSAATRTSSPSAVIHRPIAARRSSEVPDEFDWATAIARQLFCDHVDALRLERLGRSSNEPLAALARRMAAEERVHCEHVDAWVLRLGRGTDDSRARLQAALDRLAPIASSLLEPVEREPELVASGLYPETEPPMLEQWSRNVGAVVDAAGLRLELTAPQTPGGRRGVHTEHLAPLLDEMCEVYRIEPGAAW